MLKWEDYDGMPSIYISARDSGEAGYWAEKYRECGGDLGGIDPDDWRLTRRSYPAELYFPFLDRKAYGRFMRAVSKENKA